MLGHRVFGRERNTHHQPDTPLIQDVRFLLFHSRFGPGVRQLREPDGVQAYYVSQLATLPEKDDSWPDEALHPPAFDPAKLPRLPAALLHS